MHAKPSIVRRQFDKLEQKKMQLMDLLRDLPPDLYAWQPSEGTWSVAQAANHLYLSEKLSLDYLRKKLSYPDTVPPYSLKSIGSILLVKLALWTPYKVKAPKAINMWEHQAILPPKELEEKWTALRSEMIRYIESQLPAFPHHLVFKHPFAGRLTLRQTVIFFNDHMAHHMRQIRRILETHRSAKSNPRS